MLLFPYRKGDFMHNDNISVEDNFFLNSNIKHLRIVNNETQEDLAKLLGKGYSAISNYEKGIRNPDFIDLYKIAEHYNISVDDLIKKDLRFNNVKEIGEEISVDEFKNIVNGLIDKCINMTEEDKKFIKRDLDYMSDKEVK